jgi:hypothetical protein
LKKTVAVLRRMTPARMTAARKTVLRNKLSIKNFLKAYDVGRIIAPSKNERNQNPLDP